MTDKEHPLHEFSSKVCHACKKSHHAIYYCCEDCIPKWISVKHSLPENKGNFQKVLIASWSREREIYSVNDAYWYNNNFCDCFDCEEILMDDSYWEITHWMYFPSAPEAPNGK